MSDMRMRRAWLLLPCLLPAFAFPQGTANPSANVVEVQRLFAQPPDDSRILMRWWWFGPSVTTGELEAEMRRTSVARPVPYEGDRLIAAFIGRGSVAEVDPTSFRELDISGAGPIALPPGDGPRLVLLYFSSQTGQVVKRAAIGAEGYVLDHYERAAIETHLREAGDTLLAAAGPGGVHAAFCDSLEVYGGGRAAGQVPA